MSAALSTSASIRPGASDEAEVGRAASSTSDKERPLIVASHELLQGRRELWIEHRGELYRLRLTAAGKLYMTK